MSTEKNILRISYRSNVRRASNPNNKAEAAVARSRIIKN